jgi:hypothetical protein
MSVKALFMHWPVALNEPERVLDDLALWTDINTLIVSNAYWEWGCEGSPLILPSLNAFQGLGLQKVSPEAYASMMHFLSLAKEKGFQITCNICPLHPLSTDLGELRMIDITENSRAPNSDILHGCPNNPAVLNWAETMTRETVVSWASLDNVHLNHVEYPVWPRQGLKNLFVCFCDHCREKAESEGIDFDKMKHEVRSFYQFLASPGNDPGHQFDYTPLDILNFFTERPYLKIWITFRMNSLTKFIEKVTKECRGAAKNHLPNLKIGLEFFLPSLSKLFGTDFDELYSLYDWVAPKYPEYLTGSIIPLVADEITSASKRGDTIRLRKVMHEITDLGPGPAVYQSCDPKEEDMFYTDTFNLSTVKRQMKHLQNLEGKLPLYPYAWIYNHDLKSLGEKLHAFRDIGFDGYCLWPWEPDLTTEAIKKAKGVY